ncbi:MAG TPA: aminopeptidase P family protein, partial [Firmicutes bacterium]|nr:aminopeptidase P family protein [Bacillota bacterium]
GVAHRQPTGAVIKPGDILLVDMSVKYQHYVSDVARTLYFLRPGESHAPETIESAFRVVHRAISEAAAALRPGVKGYEVDAVARRVLTTSGYQEISHALGHQIGRSTHDGGTTLAPRWERYGQAPYGTVRAGEVYTLEPTIIQPEISILTEEDVVVTEWGVRWLSRRQEELICR